MPIGLLFWMIFIILIIFGGLRWRGGPNWQYGWGGDLIIFVLLFLLGWLRLYPARWCR